MKRKKRSIRRIAIVVAEPRWRKNPEALSFIRRAARLAMNAVHGRVAASKNDAVLTILLADDAQLQALNLRFRKKDKPTNVLSFPSQEPAYLGDIALSYRTIASEARAQKKRFSHHAAHMAVHGVLHLLGFDHERAREAAAMEELETALLAKLKIAPPYDS